MNYRQAYTLFKRGRVWYYRVYDDNGKRIAKSTGQTSKGAARVYCDNLLKADALRFRGQTFGEYAHDFFAKDSPYCKANTLSRNTVNAYSVALVKVLIPHFKNTPLSNITFSTVLAFRSELVEKFSPNSVNSYIGVLKMILTTAQKDGLITRSPFIGLKKLPVGVCSDAFTVQEIKALLDRIESKEARFFTILIALTGMRIAEAIGVRGNDYTQIDGVDCIHLTKQKRDSVYTQLKNKAERTIPVISEIKGITYPHSVSHFYENIKNGLAAINENRKIKLTVHSLRHFFITSAKSFGVPESKVETIAGHSLKGIAGVYTNYKAQDLASILPWQKNILEQLSK